MNALLWKRIGELFEAARELDGQERLDYLRGQCGADRNLLDNVLSLLHADEKRPAAELPSTVTTLSIPDVVAGRFRIIRYIAEGGMGTVFEAEDLQLQERVALKTFRPGLVSDERAIERFKQEIHLGKSVTHPNVCRLHDLVIDRSDNGSEVLYLSMEYLDGETLATRISRGPLPLSEALPLLQDMAEGLTAAHEANVIHRDFKSGNVMLVMRGNRKRAVITDFGLARTVRTSDFRSNAGMAGTVDYMPPEQIRGENLTPACDIYALGVVMYEMVTGHRPFTSESKIAVAMKHLNDEPMPPRDFAPNLDSNWNDTILRCLRKEPSERFQSALEVKEAVQGDLGPWQSFSCSLYRVRQLVRRRAVLLFLTLIAALLATVASLYYYRNSVTPVPSVAVLPIVNRTGNANLNYLSGGMTTALTNDLSQVLGLTVTAESIANAEAAKNSDLRTLGHDLGVQAIVTGSLANDGSRLLLQIELLDANSGSLIWGETYLRSQGELAGLQEEVARELAYRLRMRLKSNASDRLQRQYRTSSAAYDAYLKGQYALKDRSPAGFESALGFFQQAIDHDPQYAPAFAGMADCYCLMAYNRIQPTLVLLDKCKDAANRALHFDSTLADAYSSLAGAVTLADFNWDVAEEMYRRSIELNPKHAQAHLWYGLTLLTPLGRHTESLAQLESARRLDPEAPISSLGLALVEYYAAQYDASIGVIQEMKKKSLSIPVADEILVSDYLAKNMPSEAIKVIQQAPPPSEQARRVMDILLGLAYVQSGQKELARQQLSKAEVELSHGYPLNYQVGTLCAALGDHDKALGYLEKALSARQTSILFVNVDPLADPIRSDERFRRLLSSIHLQ